MGSTHANKAGDIQGVNAIGFGLLGCFDFSGLGTRSIPITFGLFGFLGFPQVLWLQKKV